MKAVLIVYNSAIKKDVDEAIEALGAVREVQEYAGQGRAE